MNLIQYFFQKFNFFNKSVKLNFFAIIIITIHI